MDRSRGQYCGDIDLSYYLANAAGSVALVLDLRISNQSLTTDLEVVLTLTLMDTYITLTIRLVTKQNAAASLPRRQLYV